MTGVFLTDALPQERSALRPTLLDLEMEITGEAADWPTTLAKAPISRSNVLFVGWDLIPDAPQAALKQLRKACPAAPVVIFSLAIWTPVSKPHLLPPPSSITA